VNIKGGKRGDRLWQLATLFQRCREASTSESFAVSFCIVLVKS